MSNEDPNATRLSERMERIDPPRPLLRKRMERIEKAARIRPPAEEFQQKGGFSKVQKVQRKWRYRMPDDVPEKGYNL